MKFQVNHDLHLHTHLSLCSNDPEINPDSVLRFGEENDYECLCITDHYWDEHCAPAPNGFYAPQDTARVKRSLPLPESTKLRYCFGCETDFWGGDRIGVSPESYDLFDFIVVPPNHLHMESCDPAVYNTAEKRARLFEERMEELTRLALPWKKIGLAHLTCGLTYPGKNAFEVFNQLDMERIRMCFRFLAEHGAGMELNASCFRDEVWEEHREECLRMYRPNPKV